MSWNMIRGCLPCRRDSERKAWHRIAQKTRVPLVSINLFRTWDSKGRHQPKRREGGCYPKCYSSKECQRSKVIQGTFTVFSKIHPRFIICRRANTEANPHRCYIWVGLRATNCIWRPETKDYQRGDTGLLWRGLEKENCCRCITCRTWSDVDPATRRRVASGFLCTTKPNRRRTTV